MKPVDTYRVARKAKKSKTETNVLGISLYIRIAVLRQ